MIYIVDGHNLIPKIPGLSLKLADDEERLVKLLQIYARVRRVTVEVYFDQAAPGHSGVKQMGMVKAHFISKGITADEEIIRHIHRLKNSARGVTVVTSDRHIQVEAQAYRARLISSEIFAARVMEAVMEAESSGNSEGSMRSGGEVDEWLKLFGAEDEMDK